MRRLLVCVCVLLATVLAADRDLAGKYAGEWKSGGSGYGGGINFSIEPAAGGAWKSQLTFGLESSNVTTIMREVTLQDGNVQLIYDFEAQGTALRSNVKGKWDGSAFKGDYRTTLSNGSDEVDSGTWSASKAK